MEDIKPVDFKPVDFIEITLIDGSDFYYNDVQLCQFEEAISVLGMTLEGKQFCATFNLKHVAMTYVEESQ